MFQTRILLGCVLLLASAGCNAQAPGSAAASPAASAGNTALDRRIETMVRNELNVPPEYEVAVGTPGKSELPGYDTVAVTFSLPGHPDHTQTLEYLVSKDGNTLARLSKWDIGKDPAAAIPVGNRPVRGNPMAKVTLANVDDLECPFCARMHAELFPGVLDRYKGLIKIVYIDFPLTEIHPWAMHAAVDANCLAAENHTAYWNYVDYVHSHGEDVSGPEHDRGKSAAMLDKLAREEGAREHLDATKLDGCLAKQDTHLIEAEMKAADRLGVSATPTFFVNGERWSGLLPPEQLDLMIDRALREQGITPPPAESAAAPAATK